MADHLRFGAHMNPDWDAALAQNRIEQLGLDPAQKAGKLSGGQRAQLALTLAIAKRPELLILDEPIASLDPLARREFLQILMEATAEQELSVVMSSHLVADLERVADYLIVLVDSRVQVDGETEDLLASHRLLTGPRTDASALPPGAAVITESHTGRQSTFLIRSTAPVHDPAWAADPIDLEDLVLAYMGKAASADARPALEHTMIWMTWRQFRAQAIAAGAILLALAVALGITGAGLASDFNGAGLNACHASCTQDATNFMNSLSGSSYDTACSTAGSWSCT